MAFADNLLRFRPGAPFQNAVALTCGY